MSSSHPPSGSGNPIEENSNAPGDIPNVDIPDMDIPPPDPSNLDDKYNCDLDVPRLDTSVYGAATSDPQTATGSATQAEMSGVNEDTPEPGNAVATIDLPHLQIAQQYIDLLWSAALDLSGMQANDINELHNLEQEYTLVDPSPLLCSVRHFVNNLAASWKHYEVMQTIECLHRPNDLILSFDQVKQHVQWLSGVMPIEHDMCKLVLSFHWAA